jgi:hypothetical protein
MSQQDALTSYKTMKDLFSQYQATGNAFSQKGGKEKTVWTQAQRTFNEQYGQNGKGILDAMAGYIAQNYGGDAWAVTQAA